VAVLSAAPTRGRATWQEDLREGVRTIGTLTFVGVLAGWFVVGVLSRLAMFLLVVLNPRATGVTSDDGFVMGQFTLSGSLNLLLLVGTPLGVLGAGLYAALRGLRVGPAWFRLLSVSVGAGVVVGSQLVHTDGVDFRLLDPLWLAVGLFVLLPTIYVALLSATSERLLARDRPMPTWLVAAGMAAWIGMFPLLPLLVVLGAGFLALRASRRSPTGRRLVESPVGPWLLRVALAVLFVAAVADIARDVSVLA